MMNLGDAFEAAGDPETAAGTNEQPVPGKPPSPSSPRRIAHVRSNSDSTVVYYPQWPFLYRQRSEPVPMDDDDAEPESDAQEQDGHNGPSTGQPGMESPSRDAARMEAVTGLMGMRTGEIGAWLDSKRLSEDSGTTLGEHAGIPVGSWPRGGAVDTRRRGRGDHVALQRSPGDQITRASSFSGSPGTDVFSGIKFPSFANLPVSRTMAPRRNRVSPNLGSSPLQPFEFPPTFPRSVDIFASSMKRPREEDLISPRRTPSSSSFASDAAGPSPLSVNRAESSGFAGHGSTGLDVASLDLLPRPRPTSYHSSSSADTRTPYEKLDSELAFLSPQIPQSQRLQLLLSYAFGAERSEVSMTDPGMDSREAKWRVNRAWEMLEWWFGSVEGARVGVRGMKETRPDLFDGF